MPEAEEVLEHITKFASWLAGQSVRDVPLMDYDEIRAELNLEIVKGIQHYDGKPMNELLALLRRMCDNRISELKYRYTITHRKAAIIALPISVVDIDGGPEEERAGGVGGYSGKSSIGYRWVIDNAVELDAEIDSTTRVSETRRRLSPFSKKVFDAVIYGHPNMATQLLLSGTRAGYVYKSGGSIRPKPRHVAEALAVDEAIVKIAFKEIRQVYAEVRREYG